MTQDAAAMSAPSAGSVANGPVAWMVADPSGRIEACRESFDEAAQLAADFTATENGDVIYKVFAVYSRPQPALTDTDREAIGVAIKEMRYHTFYGNGYRYGIADKLAALLERIK
jgi:predicted DNA binding protein